MPKTPVCGVLGIDVSAVQGPLSGAWRQGVALAAAVSDAGGLGGVPSSVRTAAQVRKDVARLRELTGRSFAVNLTRRPGAVEGLAG